MFFGDPVDARTALAGARSNRVVPAGEALLTACRMAASWPCGRARRGRSASARSSTRSI